MKNSSLIKLVAAIACCAAPLAAQATTWTAILDIEDQRLAANWDDDSDQATNATSLLCQGRITVIFHYNTFQT